MKVVVLGGHDRLKARVEQMAKKYNISLKFINQETQQNIDSALACADWVIVFTSLSGHNMVKLAKRYAKERCIFLPFSWSLCFRKVYFGNSQGEGLN
jgi:hypothetical protein